MKKYMIFSLLLCLAALQTNANNTPSCTDANTSFTIGKKVDLLAGTTVMLELAERISSQSMTSGQLIKFRVSTNVVVDGKIAIRTGALAIGRVKSVRPSSYNNAEEITIEVTTVQAVDGQQVALDGKEQTFKGQFSNQGTDANVGLAITSTVMNNITIKTN